jgi:predicted ATPase
MLIARQSDGCIAMLAHLCAMASLKQGGLIAIEEPENSLHPWAIRRLVEAARDMAARREGTILFTTHSPVLLNQFTEEPEQVFYMTRNAPITPLPLRLSEERDRDWLASFVLGELYEHGDFGGAKNGQR